jgi:hypothetical protein
MKSIVIVNPVRYTGFGYVNIISKFFKGYVIIALWSSQDTRNRAVNGAMSLIDMHVILSDNYNETVDNLKHYNPQCFLVGEDSAFTLADKLQCEFFPDYCNDPDKMQYRTSKYEYLTYLHSQGAIDSTQFILDESTIDRCKTGSWVVKPSNGAGNINVHIKPSIDLIEQLLTTDETYMVQKFVEGPEYCMEICSYNGIHRCTMASLYKGEYLADEVYPWREENELISPDDPNVKILYDYVVNILDTLGMKIGLTWTQVKIDNGVPNLIEINFRSQGRATIGPIQNATGSNWANESLLAYLKLPTKQPMFYKKLGEFNKICVNNYREKLIENMNWSEINQLPSVAYCETRKVEGMIRPVTTNFTNALGVVMIGNTDSEQYHRDLDIINSWKLKIGS